MAAFVMKRTGFGAGPIGKKGTISDASMTALLATYRAIYGQVPNGAGGQRDMTDDEVTARLFDTIITGLVRQAVANSKEKAAAVAASAVPDIPLTMTDDNTN